MSGIEGIGKLRESSHLDDDKWTLENGDVVIMCGSEPNDPNAVNWGEQWRKIADEIEREISERYMELPVDADGEPIRVGETVYGKYMKGNHEYTVRGFVFDQDYGQWNVRVGDVMWVNQNMLSHVDPRTLESILCDALAEVSCMGDGIVRTFKPDEPYVAELAAEIRELMEVGE